MNLFTLMKLQGLLELQKTQAIKRGTIYRETSIDELDAIKRLAFHCFKEYGFIETRADEVGFYYVGFYNDGKAAPRQIDQSRVPYQVNVLRGTTFTELREQAKYLGLIKGKISLRKVTG